MVWPIDRHRDEAICAAYRDGMTTRRAIAERFDVSRRVINKVLKRNKVFKHPGELRFWRKVGIRTKQECWPWKASKSRLGYGQIGWQGRVTEAHRVAFELTHGEIPAGAWLVHSCKSPDCCNPKHIISRTKEDSIRDDRQNRVLYARAWRANNKRERCYQQARRRARKWRATPSWADLGVIKKIYESCPSGHHVDHIVPLRTLRGNKLVACGLHCEANLQYLTATENVRKRCSLPDDLAFP